MTTAMTTPFDGANKEKNLLVERYKTKICRNYVVEGFCPYETRCMFAHGEHELRTSEMNLADGLITEEAIKSYQRILSQRKRQMQLQQSSYASPPNSQPSQHISSCSSETDATTTVAAPPEYFAAVSQQSNPDIVQAPLPPSYCECAECRYYYQHNPYGYYPTYTEECSCPDCMAYYYGEATKPRQDSVKPPKYESIAPSAP